MNLYEIDAAITALVDPETGEVSDFDAFDRLSMARDQKIENIALYYKNLVADAAAYKAEKLAFADRQKAAENKAQRLKVQNRLAHRRARHATAFRKFGLVQEIAGVQLAKVDAGQNLLNQRRDLRAGKGSLGHGALHLSGPPPCHSGRGLVIPLPTHARAA